MRSIPVSLDDIYRNGGYSAKYFVPHLRHFTANHGVPGLQLRTFRNRIEVQRGDKQVIATVHWNGRTPQYMTVLTPTLEEIATFPYTVEPEVLTSVIAQLVSE